MLLCGTGSQGRRTPVENVAHQSVSRLRGPDGWLGWEFPARGRWLVPASSAPYISVGTGGSPGRYMSRGRSYVCISAANAATGFTAGRFGQQVALGSWLWHLARMGWDPTRMAQVHTPLPNTVPPRRRIHSDVSSHGQGRWYTYGSVRPIGRCTYPCLATRGISGRSIYRDTGGSAQEVPIVHRRRTEPYLDTEGSARLGLPR